MSFISNQVQSAFGDLPKSGNLVKTVLDHLMPGPSLNTKIIPTLTRQANPFNESNPDEEAGDSADRPFAGQEGLCQSTVV